MSVLLTNSNDILNNPSNNSPSKAHYAFNKEPRFDALYKAANPSVNKNYCYFEGPDYKRTSTLSKEHGKVGKNARLDNVFVEINRHNIYTPCSFNYNIPTMFNKDKKRIDYVDKKFGGKKVRSSSSKSLNKTINHPKQIDPALDAASFGAPRESFYNVVGPSKFNYLPKKPSEAGPGQYETIHPYKEIGGKYIKQNRFTIPERKGPLFKVYDNPGPGQYKAKSVYVSPGVISQKADVNPQATYCNRIVEYNNPGPSDYSHSIDFGAKYKNYLDTKPVYQGNQFGKEGRKVFKVTNLTPGPGSYLAPSIFGQYMDKSYMESFDRTMCNTTIKSQMQSTKSSRNGGGGSRIRSSKSHLSKQGLITNNLGMLQPQSALPGYGSMMNRQDQELYSTYTSAGEGNGGNRKFKNRKLRKNIIKPEFKSLEGSVAKESIEQAEEANLQAINGQLDDEIEGLLQIKEKQMTASERLNNTFDEKELIRKQNKKKILQSPVRSYQKNQDSPY